MTTTTLSAQEEAIESGQKVIHRTVTDRVLRMYEAIRAYGPPRVTLDRAVLFTESFKETENQPLVLRWAKALKHFVEKVPVTIFPDELIVGRPNTWFGKWGIVYPELDGSVMPAGVEMFKKNKGKPGDVTVTEEDDRIISEVLTPYWAGRDFSTDGGTRKFQDDPHWRDCLLFHEYFHGDNGAGLGASHQTGWTGVIARTMHLFATTPPEQVLELGKATVITEAEPARRGQSREAAPRRRR